MIVIDAAQGIMYVVFGTMYFLLVMRLHFPAAYHRLLAWLSETWGKLTTPDAWAIEWRRRWQIEVETDG